MSEFCMHALVEALNNSVRPNFTLPEVCKYDGREDRLFEFLEEFKHVVSAGGWNDNETILIISTYLTGLALNVYKSLTTKNKKLNEVINSFVQEITLDDTQVYLTKTLQSRKEKNHETITTIRALARCAEIEDEEKISKIFKIGVVP